ncbi:MAG: hypothetical protein ABIU84_00735, partial [Thermoanaerobaculia bacterium]
SENGGAVTVATRIENPEEEQSHRFPCFLPDGRSFVYGSDAGAGVSEGRIYFASLDRPERKFLYRSHRSPIYATAGYLIDAIGEHLVARRFDPETGALTGEPRLLEEPTTEIVNTLDRVASVSETGALLVSASARAGTTLVWLDRRGRRLGEIPLPKERFESPHLSPDGRRVALHSVNVQGEEDGDLWVVDLASEQASRLTFTPGLDRFAIWSPDGSEIAFQSHRKGVFNLYRRSSSGSGADSVIFESPDPWKQPDSWVGPYLVFSIVRPETGFDLQLLRLDHGAAVPQAIAATAATEIDGQLSPDGRWLCYTSNETGRDELYLVSVPEARSRFQVTTTGGRQPVWSRGGHELFYITTGNSVAALEVSLGDSPSFRAPTTLFPLQRGGGRSAAANSVFDVTPDGNRIVLLEPAGQDGQTLVVITDWQAELGAKSPQP